MPTNIERRGYLLEQYGLNQCDPDELRELDQLLNNSWSELDIKYDVVGVDWEAMYTKIIQRSPVVSMENRAVSRFPWKKIAVACAVIIIGFGAAKYLFNKPKAKTEPTALTDIKAPVTNRAMITLSNGSKIFLDSAGQGRLAVQNTVQVIKSVDGKVKYEGISKEPIYNTLTNPRGSRPVDITLSDGTRVWLNAGSTMIYPVSFSGKERNVTMTGEGYFEVAHDLAHPFFVNHGNMKVEVLGTHFNVNAYEDEPAIAVTLLEGFVKVSDKKKSGIIKPGQQARVANGTINIQKADLDEVMAWKNGLFDFESADLKTILREFSRWYDIDVEYENAIPTDKYFVILKRSDNLSTVLNALQATGVEFKIKSKKLIVKSP